MRVLQRRPNNLIDMWEEQRYLRVFPTATGAILAVVGNHGTIDKPDLRYSLRPVSRSTHILRRVDGVLRKILGLDVDPAPLQRLAEAEPRLRPTAAALRGMRPPRFASLFETFVNVVPFQQVSLEAGVAIVTRLIKRFGRAVEPDGRCLHMFPTVDSIADASLDELRECGLSLRKGQALRSLARAIEAGALVEERIAQMDTSEALGMLGDLPGIGPWSASLVLLRGFGRLDVFPPGDVGAARGLGRLLHLSDAETLEGAIERFGDRRGYLYFCALGGSLLEKGLIHPAPA